MAKVNLDKIRRFRKNAGFSQKELANRLGFKSLYSYNRKELGHVKFTADELYKLAKFFGVEYEFFFDDSVAKNATKEKNSA